MEITNNQTTEIRNYLLLKKLPIDVILEVQDHFETQIENLQFSEKLSFEEAFLKTKLNWKYDFEMVRKTLFSLGKVPRIARSIQMTEMHSLLKKAILISVIFSFVSFVFAQLVTLQNFIHYLLFSNSAVSLPIILLLLFYFFSNGKKSLVLPEIYYYNQLLLVILISTLILCLKYFLKIPDISMYSIYNNSHLESSFFSVIFNVFEDIATNIVGIYFLLFLISRLKAMKRTNKYQLQND